MGSDQQPGQNPNHNEDDDDIKDMVDMTKMGTGSENTYFSGDTFHW